MTPRGHSNVQAGKLIYNCKRCGAVIRTPYPDMFEALVTAAAGETSNPIHTCDEFQIGITELVGGNYDEGEPN